jgi:hypothetical protein
MFLFVPELICKEEEVFVTPTILTPVDFIALGTQRCYDDVNTLPCEEQLQVSFFFHLIIHTKKIIFYYDVFTIYFVIWKLLQEN